MAKDGLREVAGVTLGEVLAGKYRVERVLGIGGVGLVVAAHDMHLDQTVALKFLLPEALKNADAVARFVREARAARKIRSEHVASVFDVSTLPNGAPYIVMEYLEGADLARWLAERGPLPIELAVEFVLHAAIAVAEAHALGIVHRDLKPANLFCVRRSDGQLSIKVLDFGISKIAGREGAVSGSPAAQGHGATHSSAVMGSPHYMSPEQMRSSKDVDAQTDIWALGVTLFELVTGRPPFQAESITELAIAVANEPAPALRGLRPDAPAELEAVIANCLRKDPRHRYRNVAEFALALQPFAPKRAKASVERISGIIQAAGLSTSALVPLPLPDPRVATATSVPPMVGSVPPGGVLPAGGIPPVGSVQPVGSTTGETQGRSLRGLPVAAVSVGLAVVGALVFAGMLKPHPKHAAPVQADTPSAQPAGDPTERVDARHPETVPIETLPPAPPAWSAQVAAPPHSAPSKKSLPSGDAAVLAPIPPATAARPPPAGSPSAKSTPAAAAKCEPPWYFDAKGNRLFKKECL